MTIPLHLRRLHDHAARSGSSTGSRASAATPTYATNLVQLIGLGIAVDYSLLIVYRFREELAAGQDVDDAVVRTMQTAGRAVVFSGIAVALGLALLVAMPLPFIRMLGVAGFLIPIVSILAAATLQPVLLSYYGRARHRAAPACCPAAGRRRGDRLLGAARPLDHGRDRCVYLAGGVGGARSPLAVPGVLHPADARLDATGSRARPVGARVRPAAARGRARGGRAGPDPRRAQRRLGARRRRRRRRSRRLVGALDARPRGGARSTAGAGRHFVDPTRRYEQVLVAGRHDYGFPQAQAFVAAAARAR